jgi:hypothetical protein
MESGRPKGVVGINNKRGYSTVASCGPQIILNPNWITGFVLKF